MKARDWIEQLQLLPHPEGGYYKETYRCAELVSFARFEDKRTISTAIYFLLEGQNKSHLHRIKSDELWFFHEGDTLEIFCFSEKGIQCIKLGKNIFEGEQLQAVIPAGIWFGARVKDGNGYALVSCTVAPGFDFRDFEMGRKEEMKRLYPGNDLFLEEMCLE
ncbi:MAG TPA: cupin domain-containing protein [Cytophagaceae bacterium]|nr:cupin domain-containing protein [Cytophagaceae bacterium]